MPGKRQDCRATNRVKQIAGVSVLMTSISATACSLAVFFTFICAPIAIATKYDPMTVERIRAAAQAGNVTSQLRLGWMYQYGKGVSRDYRKAVKWYRKAAEAGNAPAQGLLGRMCQLGWGVKKSCPEALKWCRKSAEQGNREGQYCMGGLYFGGCGVRKDYNEALKWHRKAAEAGHINSQMFLGVMYQQGYGTQKDYREAARWFEKAARAGQKFAQTSLAYMYEHGHGLRKDYNEAIRWYRKAADAGFPQAQTYLGQMYEHGRGVPRDRDQAVRLYRRAAKKNWSFAIRALKRLGEPISIDPTVEIQEVKTDPSTVRAGQVFRVVAVYKATDPGTKAKRVPVDFRYTIEKNGNALMTINPKTIQSDNGLKMSHKEKLTASRRKGIYTIRVIMNIKDKSAEKTLDFEIR
jgi:TPR repeat protein